MMGIPPSPPAGLAVGSGAEARDVLRPRRPAPCRRLRALSEAGMASRHGLIRGIAPRHPMPPAPHPWSAEAGIDTESEA